MSHLEDSVFWQDSRFSIVKLQNSFRASSVQSSGFFSQRSWNSISSNLQHLVAPFYTSCQRIRVRSRFFDQLGHHTTNASRGNNRVSVQGVKSLGGHFAWLCRGFEFYEVKKNYVIIFQKENGNTFTLFIIFIVKSLQKEQNSTNLLL